MKSKGCILILLCFFGFNAFGQVDSLNLHIRGSGVAGTKGFGPHWLVSNRYGIYSDSSNDVLLMPGFSLPMHFGKKLKINLGFDGVIKPRIKSSFIYEGYANVSYGKLKLMMGRQEFTLGQYNNDVSSGSFIVSNNALPIPQIGLGFYDYVDVPFTKGYLQVKGGVNQGWMDNNRLDNSPYNKPLLHEKFAYIRTRKLPVNLFLGAIHFVMYGGVDKNGNKVPVHYLDVVLAKHVSSGSEINAYGEHLGIIDLGLTGRYKDYDLTYYNQLPVTDRTGLEKNFTRNIDFFTGILVQSREHKLISAFTYEFDHTTQQGGLGLPDPVVNGTIREPWSASDREYLKEYYSGLGYPVNNLNTQAEWQSFLQAYTDYGYEFGGRVDYYNNYQYKDVYYDKIIGTSLFITKPQLKRMTGITDPGDYIVDNRVLIHHLGIEGYFSENFTYRFLLTFTRNLGAWQEYGGRYKWEGIAVDPNFSWYWKGARIQWYSMLEMGYTNKNFKNLTFHLGGGYDFGDIYHNFGFTAGIDYNWRLKL